eukprot:387416-Amphidinium_carterae.1
MVGPKLRDCPEAWPKVRLPAPAEAEVDVPPWLDRGSPYLKRLMLKVLTGVSSPSTPSPGAWTVTGKRA